MFMTAQEKASLYAWAFAAGMHLLNKLEEYYDAERAGKKMESFLLTLRSELLPERFRRSLIDYLIEVSLVVEFLKKLKVGGRWRTEKFYLYSTAVLSGLFEVINNGRKKNMQRRAG
jgi:hypothetical protein